MRRKGVRSVSEKDLDAVVEGMRPMLDEMEARRQWVIEQRNKGNQILLIASLLALGVGLFVLISTESMFGLMVGGGVFGVSWFIVRMTYFAPIKARYEQDFKGAIYRRLTEELVPGMQYTPMVGLSQAVFESAGLHQSRIDRYHSEDQFSGKVGDTELWFSEVKAERKDTSTDSDGRSRTSWHTVFDGILWMADFNKHFSSDVVVQPDIAEKAFGWFGSALQKLGGSLVKLENTEFERHFVVRGADQVEARYILTPDLQERILELRGHLNDSIQLAFRGRWLFLCFANKSDWFEVDLEHPSDSMGQIKEFAWQLQKCCGIVEQLNLNTRIWLKE